MTQNENPQSLTSVSLKIHPGATLSLRLSIRNQMNEIVLLHPTLDDWIGEDNQILSTVNRLFPSYIYLVQGGEASQTMTVEMPLETQPGQILKSWLRFPGLQEKAILVKVEILPDTSQSNENKVVDLPLSVTLPLSEEENKTLGLSSDPTTAGIFGLIGGLLDLDKIPSGWLAAELLVLLAQKGEEYARTPAGVELLAQLKGTGFFQNGAIAFTKAQLPNWISQSLSAANAVLTDRVGIGRLLEIWESWLLSLIHTDLEADAIASKIAVSPLFIEGFAAKMGGDSERWFGAIALGLAAISPRIAGILKISVQRDTAAIFSDKSDRVSYTLATGLSSLDASLPARWLAVELLLLLAEKGDEFARTEIGKKLLVQLGSTRFFKNGVLAMAAAQAPRFLAVSQSAASAYHASIGGQPGQQGMLYMWERWLWSLTEFDSQIEVPDFSGGAVIAALEMDGDRWFAALILGLAQLSPKLAAIVNAVLCPSSGFAALPVAPAIAIIPQATFEDVLSEEKSIQR